jgi:hypothetical protein
MLAVGADLLPLPQYARGHALEWVHRPGHGDLWRVYDQRVHVIVFLVAPGQEGAGVAARVPGCPVHVAEVPAGQHTPPVFGHRGRVNVQGGNHVPAAAAVASGCRSPSVNSGACWSGTATACAPHQGSR